MIDYLLQFDGEAAASDALPEFRSEASWTDDVLPVVLVTSEAEFGEPDDEGRLLLITPRQHRPGFFLLAPDAGLPGEVAAIERATGLIVSGDQSLAGARLDPAWAGAEPWLRVGG